MLVEVAKRCSECCRHLQLAAFFVNTRGRYGRHSVCRECSSQYEKNKRDRILLLGDARIPSHRRCCLCRANLPAEAFGKSASSRNGLRTYCKECDKIVRRAGKYGIGRQQVAEMLQQPRCEACDKPFATDSDKHFDHRHSDGAVRGVLCDRCNTTLGKCDENPAVLMALCDYLNRTKGVDYRKQPYSVTKTTARCIDLTGEYRPSPEERDQCQTKPLNP